jgi:hypothetical protein
MTLIGLGLIVSGSARAEPLTALLSMLIAEKLTSSHREEKSPTAQRVSGWREQLNKSEVSSLESIRQHPAIHTCIEKADNQNAIASYHIRKMVRFSTLLQQHLTQTGSLPEIESLNYQWPARAFSWCSKQAGIVVASDTHLITHAYNMARVVHFHHNQSGMRLVASN